MSGRVFSDRELDIAIQAAATEYVKGNKAAALRLDLILRFQEKLGNLTAERIVKARERFAEGILSGAIPYPKIS